MLDTIVPGMLRRHRARRSATVAHDCKAEVKTTTVAPQDAVRARVKQIKNLIAETEMDYEREKLNERVARLSGGVAIIQVRRLHVIWKDWSVC